MKKITLSIIALFFAGQMSFAQAVSEHAVIPVSVTLNSIFRLTVVTGGDIEFVVNTIGQYTNGITNSARYTTNFTVASSLDFSVTLQAEDPTNFLGSDDPSHIMPLNNVGYAVSMHTGASGVDGTNYDLQSLTGLSSTAVKIVDGSTYTGLSAGDATQNNFDLKWELGTKGAGMNANSLLSQSLPADRYVTNVFLDLVAE